MNVIETLKKSNTKDIIFTENLLLAKYCSLKNTHRNSALIQSNLLNIVYKGKKILHTIDGDIEVKAGEAFFLTKGEYIMSEVISDDDYECLLIFFDHEQARKIILEMPFALNVDKNHNSENIFKFTLNTHLQNSANALKLYLDDKPKFSQELINLKLKELIILILGTTSKDNFIKFCRNLIYDKSDLKSFMEANFDKNLTLLEFAKLSGRSLSGFKSEFKSIFDETPMKWILKKRLQRARFLIHELKYDVGVAALNVGFKTHSHFTRLYKEYYEVNPSFKDK